MLPLRLMSRKNKNKLFERVTIADAGAKGKSVAKTDEGVVIFLDNAVPGDVVDIQTHKKRSSYYEGKAVFFHQLSDKRTEPKCVHFGVCGGCKWQNMQYQHQLFYKQNEVENHLKRIGKIALPEITPILGSAEEYYYRNKMEFSFSNNRWLTKEEIAQGDTVSEKNALGFHIPGMWDKILDLNECHLQPEPSNKIRLAVKNFAVQNNLTFFNPKNHSGLLRTLMLRNTTQGQWMVLIQFFEDHELQQKQVLDFLAATFPEITSLLYTTNQKANDTLYDQEILCYKGKGYIMEEMEGLQFKINAKSFYQTNPRQAYELYKITRNFAGLTGTELVYDLYTGTGTIAQFVAKNAKKVVGIESVPDAIIAAKENALLNQIDNVSFYVGDMKNVFTDEFIEKNGKPDVIITDPPRDGMHKDVVEQILNIAPQKVVYVSCNSATQARDIALMDSIYKVTKVQPVDMFPQTHHVENVVLLEIRQ